MGGSPVERQEGKQDPPRIARAPLVALINPEGDYSFTAKMTLREYRAGG